MKKLEAVPQKVKIMNKYKKLLSNTGLITLGTFGSKILVFFLTPLYTYLLSDSEFGSADLLAQTAKLLLPLLSLGITEAVFRFALDRAEDPKNVFTAGLCILGAGSVLYAVAAPILGLFDMFRGSVWLIVCYTAASSLHSLVSLYIRTKDHFRFYAVQGVINTLLVILFNLLFLLVFDLGVTGYVLSVAVADFVVFLLVFAVEKLWRDLVPFRLIPAKLWKDMLRYSIPLIPNTVFWWIISVSDRYMVSFFVGEGANGIYTAAYKIPTLITLVCQVFSQAWTYSSVLEDDKEERSEFFSRVFTFYLAVLFVGASGIILFSKIFTGLLYHESYYECWRYIPVLTLATVFSSLVTFMGSVYSVSKKSLPAMLTVTAGAITNVVLNFLLIPDTLGKASLPGLGALGAAIATLISYMIVFTIRAATARKHVAFDMHLPLLFANTVLVGTQAVIMNLEVTMWWLYELLLMAVVLLLNGKALLPYFKKILPFAKKNEKF